MDWPAVVKLLLAGLVGMAFFTVAFVKSVDLQGRCMSCFMGIPFLILVLIAVLTGIQKCILDSGKENEEETHTVR